MAAYAKTAEMQRSFLFNSNLYYSEKLFLAGPAVGAPVAVMCLEKLIALGAKKIILYGWCGSLQEELRAMDVLLPTEALSEEGTSRHYQDQTQGHNQDKNRQREKILASPTLHTHLGNILTAADFSYQTGKIWTTDAPYRETRTKITDYAGQGIYGVDMEFSASVRSQPLEGLSWLLPCWCPMRCGSSLGSRNFLGKNLSGSLESY